MLVKIVFLLEGGQDVTEEELLDTLESFLMSESKLMSVMVSATPLPQS